MQICRTIVAIALASLVTSPCVAQVKIEYLEEEPPKDSLRYGQVKEITGGNAKRSIPRKVQCIKRPQ